MQINKKVIYWFRNDLRIFDNPAFYKACNESSTLLPIYCHKPIQFIDDKFERVSKHRKIFLEQSIKDLKNSLIARGSNLLEIYGFDYEEIPKLATKLKINNIICEAVEAPEEISSVNLIKKNNINIEAIWQSSMLSIAQLPFELKNLPDVFTDFRKVIEAGLIEPISPIEAPARIPNLPDIDFLKEVNNEIDFPNKIQNSSFPYHDELFSGGESSAYKHIQNYCKKMLPLTYKATRNQLHGLEFSTKFSPWLSLGCISARTIFHKIKEFENSHGKTESTYWIWFELLWRDYFRFLHFKYGQRLYKKKGLNQNAIIHHNDKNYICWMNGQTGNGLIDAGMRELSSTGFLSNRMRQIVASFLIYDLSCDWRKGAAWFESQLVDYDVYSNHGNWLYIAGNGIDPRGGRRFNIPKQDAEYDSQGHYKKLWLTS